MWQPKVGKPCSHAHAKDFTTQLWPRVGSSSLTVAPHIYCPDCGWHCFRGIEYNRQQWYDWINEDKNDGREVQITRYKQTYRRKQS